MKHNVLVPLALLRAALIASKDEDEFDFRNLDSIAINNGHIVATTVEQVTKFFNENKALIKAKLWSVNIPEEPDSAPILHPVPSQKIGKQLVHRLKQKALKQFPTVGQSIADSVTLEEWNGTEVEHAEYLKSNPKWWNDTTFLENGDA